MTTTSGTRKVSTSRVKEESLDLPANPLIFEVLNLVVKQKTNEKKVEVLKRYEDPSLKAIFIWNFDESIISLLPEGDVPFFGDNVLKTSTITERIGDAVSSMKGGSSDSLGTIDEKHSTLRREYKKFYNFIKGGNDSLNSVRRETIFINLLEGVHPLEAEILCLVKDKKLQTKYKITKEIVSEAYPDIQWGGRS
ncbi:MAG: DUF6433 family protein [Nitrosarchaeum sp.]|jgi:hypothetical protein|nr:DUF6433 family protein [Nitrosarchaeum sp.]